MALFIWSTTLKSFKSDCIITISSAPEAAGSGDGSMQTKEVSMDGCILTVTQLNEYVNTLLLRDPILRNISLTGEISGFKRHSSGHLYMALKDDQSLIKCVMFKQNAAGLGFLPADGMQVTAAGYAAIYSKDGQYQFYIKSMMLRGEGELYRRFLLLKNLLQSKGFFEASHKKPIPFLPRCVGVVTSGTGAAFHDIQNVIRRRFPKMNILLCPAKVQGEGAATEIANAIRTMNRLKEADVLIVGRGGGSMEDLFAFNEEAVAEAIYESRIPVISAVGHETDFTIADFTADVRAPTPSAAAELCVPDYCELLNKITRLSVSLGASARAGMNARREKVRMITGSSSFLLPFHKLQNERQRLDNLSENLSRTTCTALDSKRRELLRLFEKLESIDPKNVLKRGYVLARTAQGAVIDKVEALSRGDELQLLFNDGSADVLVKDTRRTYQ